MEVLGSTEKMDLGLQGRAAIVAASKGCFSSATKQPADGLPLSNSVRAQMTGLARTPANEYAPFGIAANTFGRGTRTALLDALAKSFSKRSNVKPEEVPAGRTREIPACPASQRASYVDRTFLAVDGGYCGAPSNS
jgi:NAD(P)-dependent dehydrogenase (short-subunit alcohol dehydrogenase family)